MTTVRETPAPWRPALWLATLLPMAMAVPPAAAQSGGVAFWDHNGSEVRLEAERDLRRFYYSRPRESLVNEGVDPGTLLFDGRRTGDSYSGTAHVFSRRCGTASYPVRGTVAADQRSVTLTGQAPRRDAACAVIGYRDDVLVFTYLRSETPEGRVAATPPPHLDEFSSAAVDATADPVRRPPE